MSCEKALKGGDGGVVRRGRGRVLSESASLWSLCLYGGYSLSFAPAGRQRGRGQSAAISPDRVRDTGFSESNVLLPSPLRDFQVLMKRHLH